MIFLNYKLSDVNHCHEVCCMLDHLGVIKTDSFDQKDIKQAIYIKQSLLKSDNDNIVNII